MENKKTIIEIHNGRKTLNGFVKARFYVLFCPFVNENVKLQGTWELKYAMYLNDNNIKWIKGKVLVYYKDNKKHKYLPDFYLPIENEYHEIKGFFPESAQEKMQLVKEQHPDKIIKLLKY